MRSPFRGCSIALVAVLVATSPAHSGIFDELFGGGVPSDEKIAAGLKEALEIGAGNAVGLGSEIDAFVTGKSLEGLFHVLGEEEKKSRKDPAARVTKLLKHVFAHAAQ